MRIINKFLLKALLLTNLIMLNACSDTSAKISNDKTNNNIINKAELSEKLQVETTNSPIQAKLDKAQKDGKAVFVVVTGSGATNTNKALDIASGAKEIYKNAVIVQMNRDDAANETLVAKWRLATAPLPIILVISPKGSLTGGRILKQATAENIAMLVPSPKLQQVYDAISNKKYAIVALTKESFADRKEVIKECKKAVSLLNTEAVFIEVNMADPKEKSFMQQLRINPITAKSSISLVINKQGQVAGQSKTIPDASKLVAAAKTPVKSGCGPGCGPAGCGK